MLKSKELRKKIIIAGIVGLIATIGVGIGEFLLHYSPNGIGYDSNTYLFFNEIPLNRLTLGHFVAISFTPLYIVGYYHLYLIFKEKNPRIALIILILGIIAFMIGGMWISSRAQLGYLVHAIADNPNNDALESLLQVYIDHAEILVKSLRFWVAGISVAFVIPILKNQTLYPRWMAIFNPLFMLILVLVIYKFLPQVGYFIGPIAMNVAHFILFAISLFIIIIKPN